MNNKFLIYLLVILMLVTSKRSVPITRNVVRTAINRRSFSFSNNSKKNHYQLPFSTSSSNNNGNYDSLYQSYNQYDIAIAFQAKDREELNLFKKKHNKPSPALQSPTGEDNLLVSQQIQGYITVGVADGVGGWSEAGYDSSAISRELCHQIRQIFETNDNINNLSPKLLLDLAFKSILKSPKVEIGGTTACLGIFSPNKTVKIANLGDSWVGHFRNYKLIQQTNFQTHNFNTPYQLAKIPPQIVRQAEQEGRRYIIDTPDLADEYEWNLQKDDILIFATDGVTDNIVPQDIEIFLKDNLTNSNPKLLNEISDEFVKQVVKVSKDTNFPSSFAQELSKLTGQQYLGGKEDDITVVMVKVK